MILRTRIRLKRMSAQTNNCSLFLFNGEGAPKGQRGLCQATGKLNENRGESDASLRIYEDVEASAFPIAPSSHSHTA